MQLTSDFKLKLFPNGECSLGWVPNKRHEDRFEGKDKNLGRLGSTWWRGKEELRRWVEREISSQKDCAPLVSTQDSNSHKRGQKGITSYGSKAVRNAAYLLQSKYGKDCLSFLTLSLPVMSVEEEKRLAGDWSRVIRVFGQRLKRLLQSRGLQGNYVGVTEIQEKRFRAGKGIGLHLHVVFRGRLSRRHPWAVSWEEFRVAWCSVLSTVLGHRVYSPNCENVKSVYKSAEGYLGKYMSKGVLIIDEVRDKYGEDAIPSAWYFLSKPMRDAVKSRVRVAWDRDVDVMSQLPYLCRTGAISRVGLKFLDIGGKEFLIGVSFQVNRDKIGLCHKGLSGLLREIAPHATEF